MALSKEELDTALEIIKALDDAILQGPWEYNLLFKGVGKGLRDMRENFIREMGLEEHFAAEKKEHVAEAQASDSMEIYVSLYQAEGSNLHKWQIVVNSLAGYNVNRPIYQNEDDIQKAIRNKSFRQNDAYVAVKIRKEDIMPLITDKPPTDRNGYPLLTLREGAIKTENITRFSHMNGEYDFRNGVLTKRS